MSFKLEKEMLPVMNNNLKIFLEDLQYFGEEEIKLKATELPNSYRMVDMAVTGIERNLIEKDIDKFKKSFRYLSFISLSILKEFYMNTSLSVHFINKFFSDNKDMASEVLSTLERLELIEKVSKFRYQETGWSKIIPRKIIAMEFKLSKWEEALNQGIDNLSFAEYSYVILDESKIPKTKEIDKYFINNNIGLLYLNENGEIQKRHIPKENKKMNNKQSCYQKVKIIKELSNNTKWELVY